MLGRCTVPVLAEIRLMQEFRFLPPVGMTYQCVTPNR